MPRFIKNADLVSEYTIIMNEIAWFSILGIIGVGVILLVTKATLSDGAQPEFETESGYDKRK